MINMNEKVEFRIIDSEDMPPIVITQGEDDGVKVVLNTYHRLWISLKRRTIAGVIEALQEKMDFILNSYLSEAHKFEKEDREMMN